MFAHMLRQKQLKYIFYMEPDVVPIRAQWLTKLSLEERTKEGLEKALAEIPALHEEFRKDLRVTGSGERTNQTLEKAGRVDDFFELAQVMCLDALTREESCGGHFRAEHQTDEGEAERDDEHFAHVAAWEWTGDPSKPNRHTEPLTFDNVHLAVRSYK